MRAQSHVWTSARVCWEAGEAQAMGRGPALTRELGPAGRRSPSSFLWGQRAGAAPRCWFQEGALSNCLRRSAGTWATRWLTATSRPNIWGAGRGPEGGRTANQLCTALCPRHGVPQGAILHPTAPMKEGVPLVVGAGRGVTPGSTPRPRVCHSDRHTGGWFAESGLECQPSSHTADCPFLSRVVSNQVPLHSASTSNIFLK